MSSRCCNTCENSWVTAQKRESRRRLKHQQPHFHNLDTSAAAVGRLVSAPHLEFPREDHALFHVCTLSAGSRSDDGPGGGHFQVTGRLGRSRLEHKADDLRPLAGGSQNGGSWKTAIEENKDFRPNGGARPATVDFAGT